MPVYTRPDTYAEEATQLEGPIRATALGFGGMQAITKKGPAGVPTRTRSFQAWQRIFGGREAVARGDAAYEAKEFFDEGGFELITIRQVHYSDLDDITSYTGGVSYSTSITDGVAATAATKACGAETYEMDPGDDIDLDVDNVGVATATFDAAAGTDTDTTAYPVADQDTLTEKVTIDGGSEQTVTFSGVTTTAASMASQMNAQLIGCSVAEVGGQVKITSDSKGTGSSVAIGTGTCALTWAAAVAGTGDVADIKAVTAAEIKTVIEADTTATVAVSGGIPTISSPTTGAASELDFQSGTALSVLGLSVEVLTGTAAGATYNTLKLHAGYKGVKSPGVDGNSLKKKITQNPKHPTLGVGNDLAATATAADTTIQLVTTKGINAGSVIKIYDVTNTEYFEVTQVRTVISGAVVTFFADIDGALSNTYTTGAGQVASCEFDIEVYDGLVLKETFSQLSMLDTADNYVETIINDENLGSEYFVAEDLDAACGIGADLPATDSAAVSLASGTDETSGLVDADWVGTQVGGTGLYGWDSIREFMPFCTVGKNTVGVFQAALAYAESRMFMEYIGFVTAGLTTAQAVAYRENTLGASSSYGCLYAGGIKVFDPIGAGSNPQRSISGVGALMGLRARVDTLPDPNGGPWQTPAGEGDYGVLRGATDVVTEYRDSDAGTLNDASINVIRKFGNTSPVTVWGGRTLDTAVNLRFRYINVRRFFQYAQKSIVDSTRWGVFRNNDFRLWSSLKDRIDTWLVSLMPRRAFPTPEKALAFFVSVGITDGVMTQTDVDNGKVIGHIGLAPNKPGEFIIFIFSQYDSGYDVAEA